MTKTDVWTLRLRLKLTQRQLAEALDVTETTVARWEQGRRRVSPLAARSLHLLTLAHGRRPAKPATTPRPRPGKASA